MTAIRPDGVAPGDAVASSRPVRGRNSSRFDGVLPRPRALGDPEGGTLVWDGTIVSRWPGIGHHADPMREERVRHKSWWSACCRFDSDLFSQLRRAESNHLPPGYEPGELPVLYSAPVH